MTPQRYTQTAVVLHWLHAVLVFFLLGWGWYMVDLPQGPERSFAIPLHKSLGMVAIFLLLVRTLWRIYHSPVPIINPSNMDAIAQKVHRFFYILLFFTPVMGYLSASFTNYDMKFFGLTAPKPGWPDPAINDLFSSLHQWLTWCIVAFVIVHIGGGLLHFLRDRDVLQRMRFGPFKK
jgi:cytochrome b561